jgi:type I restriction enzyme, S subunit
VMRSEGLEQISPQFSTATRSDKRPPQTIPASWIWTTVGEICEVFRGASPRPKGDPRYFGGSIPWIMISDVTRQPGKYLVETREGVTEEGSKLSRRLPLGSLILSNSGTVCVPKILKVEGCIHDGFVSFNRLEKHVELDFAYWWFEHVRQQIIQENRQGVTQVNLNTSIVREIHFPLVPRSEQKSIVAEIEKQFTRLDAAVAALKRVQANLKRYRAAVLKAACEGRLVPTDAELARKESRGYETGKQLLARILKERRAKWEADQLAKMFACDKPFKNEDWKSKYREPESPDMANLPALPRGWTWATWNQLSNWVTYGFTRPMPHLQDGVPIVTAKHVANGRINFGECDLTSCDAFAALSEKDRPVRGDILITKDGSIGRGAVVDTDQQFCINQSVAVVWLRSCPCDRRFLLAVIASPLTQKPIWAKARGVAIQHLSITDFARMPVPLPPLAEQERISLALGDHFSVIEAVEAATTANLIRCERLRQSVLKCAFEGKLVPQDPNDEPSAVLLERIRAERVVRVEQKNRTRSRKYKRPTKHLIRNSVNP